jgi:hypothetical protein
MQHYYFLVVFLLLTLTVLGELTTALLLLWFLPLIIEFGAPLLIAFEAGLQILSAGLKILLSDILACWFLSKLYIHCDIWANL